jgi:hypothetical protein
VYITKTQSECIVGIVEFFPTEVPMPFLSTKDLTTEAAKQLMHVLLHPQPAGPFSPVASEQTLTLKCLAAIF